MNTVEKINFKFLKENLDWEFPKALLWNTCDFFVMDVMCVRKKLRKKKSTLNSCTL